MINLCKLLQIEKEDFIKYKVHWLGIAEKNLTIFFN